MLILSVNSKLLGTTHFGVVGSNYLLAFAVDDLIGQLLDQSLDTHHTVAYAPVFIDRRGYYRSSFIDVLLTEALRATPSATDATRV